MHDPITPCLPTAVHASSRTCRREAGAVRKMSSSTLLAALSLSLMLLDTLLHIALHPTFHLEGVSTDEPEQQEVLLR